MRSDERPLSPVPAHFGADGMFCSREGQLAPGGHCPEGHDHAEHYANDGHPECEDLPEPIREILHETEDQ